MAHRAILVAMPTSPEKQAIGPGLGRQFGTTSSLTRH
jgi:hypothetical protein